MEHETEVSKHYLGDKGKEYLGARQDDAYLPGYYYDLQYFLPYLKESDVVLDFGCGNGGMLRLLSEKVACAEGLEPNPAAREVADTTGCRLYAAIDELPGEPRYDVIVTNHVLEHIRDVCSTLEALRPVLKPGGLLVAKLPLDDWRWSYQRCFDANDTDHHLYTWTPRLFANVLYESGYDVREVRVITSCWHTRLFPLLRFGFRPLMPLIHWAFAVVKKRRQLLAVGTPTSSAS